MYQRVFINVPFDEAYKRFLDATVFTVIACGCVPRCALEDGNAAEPRLAKIVRLVRRCRMGIHDLSRSGPRQDTQLPRLNMPFELGLFLGAREFGGRSHQTKTCIVLDSHLHRYRSFLSDFAGNEVVSHDNRISHLITALRNWLADDPSIKRTRIPPGGREICQLHAEFQRRLPRMCLYAKIQREELTYGDYAHFVGQWLALVKGFRVGR